MSKSIYFELYTTATSRDEAAEIAAVVDLYNLCELMSITQMVGVKTGRGAYNILVKVRGDADTMQFNKVMKTVEGVKTIGRYRNARQVKNFLLVPFKVGNKPYYQFFKV